MPFCLSDLAVLLEPVPHPSGYVRIVEVGNDLLVLARGLVVLKLELLRGLIVLKLEFLRGSAVLSGLAGAALLGAAVAFAFIGVAAQRALHRVDRVQMGQHLLQLGPAAAQRGGARVRGVPRLSAWVRRFPLTCRLCHGRKLRPMFQCVPPMQTH